MPLWILFNEWPVNMWQLVGFGSLVKGRIPDWLTLDYRHSIRGIKHYTNDNTPWSAVKGAIVCVTTYYVMFRASERNGSTRACKVSIDDCAIRWNRIGVWNPVSTGSHVFAHVITLLRAGCRSVDVADAAGWKSMVHTGQM